MKKNNKIIFILLLILQFNSFNATTKGAQVSSGYHSLGFESIVVEELFTLLVELSVPKTIIVEENFDIKIIAIVDMNRSLDDLFFVITGITLQFWTQKDIEGELIDDLIFFQSDFYQLSSPTPDSPFKHYQNTSITQSTEDGWFSIGFIFDFDSRDIPFFHGSASTPSWSFGPIVVQDDYDNAIQVDIHLGVVLLAFGCVYLKRRS